MMAKGKNLYIDPRRCAGCRECVAACATTPSHLGIPLIHIESFDRGNVTQTSPILCMHCDNPTCAKVCPTDAIKKSSDGAILTAKTERCVACSNCVLACPFGVPTMQSEMQLMMKCDLCHDLTSQGGSPRCAVACSKGAIFFGSEDEAKARYPSSRPLSEFKFGGETVRTKVNMLVPIGAPDGALDVTAQLQPPPEARRVKLNMIRKPGSAS